MWPVARQIEGRRVSGRYLADSQADFNGRYVSYDRRGVDILVPKRTWTDDARLDPYASYADLFHVVGGPTYAAVVPTDASRGRRHRL